MSDAVTLQPAQLNDLQGQFSSALSGMILHLHRQDVHMQSRLEELEASVKELRGKAPSPLQEAHTTRIGEDVRTEAELRALAADPETMPRSAEASGAVDLKAARLARAAARRVQGRQAHAAGQRRPAVQGRQGRLTGMEGRPC